MMEIPPYFINTGSPFGYLGGGYLHCVALVAVGLTIFSVYAPGKHLLEQKKLLQLTKTVKFQMFSSCLLFFFLFGTSKGKFHWEPQRTGKTQKIPTMKKVLVLFIVALALVVADPSKPSWPEEFDAPFGMSCYIPFISHTNASAHFYYKWTDIQATLVDYETNCIPFVYLGSDKSPCKLLFNPQGIYFSNPETPVCLWKAGIGSVPPNFLAPFNFSNVVDTTDYYGNSHTCNHWKSIDFFAYWTDVNSGDDIQFLDGGVVYWNWGPLNVVPQDNSIFNVPSGTPACSFAAPKMEDKYMDPMVRLAHIHAGAN
jgi:hypothetical protein